MQERFLRSRHNGTRYTHVVYMICYYVVVCVSKVSPGEEAPRRQYRYSVMRLSRGILCASFLVKSDKHHVCIHDAGSVTFVRYIINVIV